MKLKKSIENPMVVGVNFDDLHPDWPKANPDEERIDYTKFPWYKEYWPYMKHFPLQWDRPRRF